MSDAIAAQDQFELLYTHYHRRVRAYLVAYLSRTWRRIDQDLVDDLAQETWLSAWQYLPAYDAARPAMPWLTSIARRRAVDHFRLARSTRETAADFGDTVTARRLPVSHSAEDEAVAVDTLIRMLMQPVGTPLGVAA
jgi:DNA-directed RNA polymerase specialized sigma24 family protein